MSTLIEQVLDRLRLGTWQKEVVEGKQAIDGSTLEKHSQQALRAVYQFDSGPKLQAALDRAGFKYEIDAKGFLKLLAGPAASDSGEHKLLAPEWTAEWIWNFTREIWDREPLAAVAIVRNNGRPQLAVSLKGTLQIVQVPFGKRNARAAAAVAVAQLMRSAG